MKWDRGVLKQKFRERGKKKTFGSEACKGVSQEKNYSDHLFLFNTEHPLCYKA